jgi:hypothetical protein
LQKNFRSFPQAGLRYECLVEQFEKNALLFSDQRFVAILKQMAVALVSPVEDDGMGGQQPAYEDFFHRLPT